ncbi:hypothetical protein HNQ62_000306 [Sulfurisphaera ohwakuensis]|uniref:Uncharacterized protein n=1 Tax=Sulfurisphaera ohwakuensis TaxID=69656 RepID=A0A7J9RNP7_SULOH|nr:hypothetical protein [Sulfurisphaera ohwakuensis]
MNIQKFFINNKQITIINEKIIYLDVDKVIDSKEIIRKLNFINDKIAYLDFSYSNQYFTILKLIFCKTRLHIYLCNVLLELKKIDITPEEIYNKLEDVLDKVIT